jgi:hypothetical protein
MTCTFQHTTGTKGGWGWGAFQRRKHTELFVTILTRRLCLQQTAAHCCGYHSETRASLTQSSHLSSSHASVPLTKPHTHQKQTHAPHNLCVHTCRPCTCCPQSLTGGHPSGCGATMLASCCPCIGPAAVHVLHAHATLQSTTPHCTQLINTHTTKTHSSVFVCGGLKPQWSQCLHAFLLHTPHAQPG